MDRLVSMAVFVKAVEAGSFAAAGEALGMSSQLAGKHVRALEDYLGVRLLHRTTRRHRLTEPGRGFYERAQHILAEVEAARALAEEGRAVPRGRLRLNAPVTFGAHELSLALPAFLAAHPEVAVELTLSDRTVDLIDEGFDAVFRVGSLADSGLIARRLRPYAFMLCAAPAYLAAHGHPRTPAELQQHACLGFAHGAIRDAWRFHGPDGPIAVPVTSRFVVNNGQALLNAALAGLGLIYQPAALLEPDLAAGRLVRLLPDHEPPPRPMHLLHAPDRRITPKLRAFVDFALARFGPDGR
jgi:DNA-binding transcriptional LysR family regulator